LKDIRMTFKSLTLVNQIANELKDGILRGDYKSGDQLLEDRLKETFQVSRTPLREAFRVLENEGLVEIFPWKGAFVKKISSQHIKEVFPIRATLEGLAARLAYENDAHRCGEQLEECIDRMQQCVEQNDFTNYSRQHMAFHDVFINGSKNETLIKMIHNLRICTRWQRNTCQSYEKNFGRPIEIHSEIKDLFKTSKTPAAQIEKKVRSHIMAALAAFLSTMTEDGKAASTIE
jgi:DNA-binding GntR family transcriptional regulator